MPERTWKQAFGEVTQAAGRHKLATAIVAVLVAGTFLAIGLAGAGTSGGSAAAAAGTGAGAVIPAGEPAAASFNVPLLGQSSARTSLAAYAGKPLVVNFFASWCPPCKQETPLLARFYRGEHGSVALLGLDTNDQVANALTFTRANGVTYPVGRDPDIAVASAYDVNGLPQTFFLNARHRIVYRVFGAVTAAELSKGIALATGGTAR
jgi:thiol-disulfide isomerase/thioredoxin